MIGGRPDVVLQKVGFPSIHHLATYGTYHTERKKKEKKRKKSQLLNSKPKFRAVPRAPIVCLGGRRPGGNY